MKFPERMSRWAGGTNPFHTAIATTFSIEFSAYEEVVLPQLMASGATNLLVLADERMASMSLSDGSHLPRQLGRDYELFSPPAADGLFHPKIVLQIGRKMGRLFVGSANITAAGLAGNAETVVELECQDEPTPEREVVRSAWRYVSRLIPDESIAARDALSWASDRAHWLFGQDGEPVQQLEDGTALAFLTRNGPEGIARRFIDLIGSEAVERVVVASPYWDGQLEALGLLLQRLRPNSTSVLLDLERHEFPLQVALPPGVSFRAFPSRLNGRFKHAKFVIASTATRDHILIGSANCTTAALGDNDFGGTNNEACIYRMLPRDRAVEALGLIECIKAEPLDPRHIEPQKVAPQIPFSEIASRKAGSFELEGGKLTWFPPQGLAGNGQLRVFGACGDEIEAVAFDVRSPPLARASYSFALQEPERASFVVAEQEGFLSNRAHVTHRSLLRWRRREVATGSLAKAASAFNVGDDFDLWMHSAFDELVRADQNDQPPPSSAVKPRVADARGKSEPAQALSYEEFMETRSPDARANSQHCSTLAGTHSESIRCFLNMLVGCAGETAASHSGDGADEWMKLGDEDKGGEIEIGTERVDEKVPTEPPDQRAKHSPVDVKQFERMVALYSASVTNHTSVLGPSDVLRVRFWLMLLLHKAEHAGLPNGLEASSEEQGWPRLALRVISAFFCGRKPPIMRLMIGREYAEMPIDFFECWATVLWTLGAIESLPSGSFRHAEFLDFVRKARREVMQVLGLTSADLASATMIEVNAALDRTAGRRLGLIST